MIDLLIILFWCWTSWTFFVFVLCPIEGFGIWSHQAPILACPILISYFLLAPILDRINTNDLLQTRRSNKVLSPDVYDMCFRNSETNDNLFTLWYVSHFLEENWVCPNDLGLLSHQIRGFRRGKDFMA